MKQVRPLKLFYNHWSYFLESHICPAYTSIYRLFILGAVFIDDINATQPPPMEMLSEIRSFLPQALGKPYVACWYFYKTQGGGPKYYKERIKRG